MDVTTFNSTQNKSRFLINISPFIKCRRLLIPFKYALTLSIFEIEKVFERIHSFPIEAVSAKHRN